MDNQPYPSNMGNPLPDNVVPVAGPGRSVTVTNKAVREFALDTIELAALLHAGEAQLQRACFRRDDWTCVDCGYIGEKNGGDLNADHVIPRAEGGQDVLDNLATKCVPCHKIKTQQEAARDRRRRSGKRLPPLHPADALSGPL
jgi:hypothetical protein